MAKLLSLCLPTYNRAPFLRRLLEQVEQEIKGVEKEVEIVISDNASTDDTPNILREFAARLPLRHRRNKVNVHYDANMVATFLFSRGKFSWQMGDDDLYVPGAIADMVKTLRRAPPALGGALVNFIEGKDENCLKVGFKEFKIYPQGKYDPDFYRALFIGSFGNCTLLRTDLVQRVIRKNIKVDGQLVYKKNLPKDPLAFRYFVHWYLMLECIKAGPLFGVYPKPGTRFQGGGSFAGQGRILSWAKVAAEQLRQFRTYYPAAYSYGACSFGPTALRFLPSFLMTYDPGMKQEYKDLYYQGVDGLIAEYRANKDPLWLPYAFFIEAHRRLFFMPHLVWAFYVLGARLKGHKPYTEREKEKQTAGLVGGDALEAA